MLIVENRMLEIDNQTLENTNPGIEIPDRESGWKILVRREVVVEDDRCGYGIYEGLLPTGHLVETCVEHGPVSQRGRKALVVAVYGYVGKFLFQLLEKRSDITGAFGVFPIQLFRQTDNYPVYCLP